MKFIIEMNDDRKFTVLKGHKKFDEHKNLELSDVLKLLLKTFYAELPKIK